MKIGMFKRMTMALVGGISLLFLVQCSNSLKTAAAQRPGTEAFRQFIGAPDVGDNVVVGAYCVRVDIPFMKAFTALVVNGGDSAYWEFVNQQAVPCYDYRKHQVNSVRATLVKKLWEFELPTGQRFNMWEVMSQTGNPAYTWLPIDGQEV